jgi:hypothetical protein
MRIILIGARISEDNSLGCAGASVYIVPRTGLAQTCKRTEMLQNPPNIYVIAEALNVNSCLTKIDISGDFKLRVAVDPQCLRGVRRW